ncbi:ATP-grasp domain-containing protein [Streptomyces sp. NPDC001828]|uniref:ATP-grasp domain-containing protein n=1 Tax=Streptomyces sp. NPDC001828 TaxID=3364615 RepID=UPI00369B34EB
MPNEQTPPARRILVTGVGANPGFGLARALQRLGHHVICTDAEPLAPGLLLPDTVARVTPRADHTAYAATMIKLCRDTRPHAIMAGIENDLVPLLKAQRALARSGVRMWLPSAHSLETCLDKARFHQVLTAHGIPTPHSVMPHQLDDLAADEAGLMVKPRRGHGAQNVYYCSTREQARVLCELVPDPLIQRRIHGQEFTADCLVDRASRASVILRRRDLVKGGLAAVSTTFHDDGVEEQVRQTLMAVDAAGLCCVQGFITDGGPEAVVITELNVRVAGGFALAEAAGADLIGQTVNGLFHRPVDHDRLAYKPGIFLTHYTETLAFGDQSLLPRHEVTP